MIPMRPRRSLAGTLKNSSAKLPVLSTLPLKEDSHISSQRGSPLLLPSFKDLQLPVQRRLSVCRIPTTHILAIRKPRRFRPSAGTLHIHLHPASAQTMGLTRSTHLNQHPRTQSMDYIHRALGPSVRGLVQVHLRLRFSMVQ